jgi:hypothetical protein
MRTDGVCWLHTEVWSVNHWCSAAVRQVVRGGPQAVSKEKSLQKLYQTLNEGKIHPYMSLLKLPLLVDLQQLIITYLLITYFHDFLSFNH